jgi:hypothetical protein
MSVFPNDKVELRPRGADSLKLRGKKKLLEREGVK